MKQLLFVPQTLTFCLEEIGEYLRNSQGLELSEYMVNSLAQTHIYTGYPPEIIARLNLLHSDFRSFFSTPDIDSHPNQESYVLRWESVNIQKNWIPDYLQNILESPHDLYSGLNSSYSSIPGHTEYLIVVKPGATIEDCLNTLKEWERVSDWIEREYDMELNENEGSIWDMMGLSGDDDVDYQGSYLDSVIQFFRIYLYIHTDDKRFLNPIN